MMNSVEYDRVIEEPGSHPQAKSMPIDASTQVHFIQRLQREGRLSLDAVYDIFFKTPKSRNPQTLAATFRWALAAAGFRGLDP